MRSHQFEGAACTFTRTAHSEGAPSRAPGEREALNLARRAARVEADVSAEIAGEKKTLRAQAAAKKVKVPCEVCGLKMSSTIVTGTRIGAHQNPQTNRWCRGGVQPTDAQRTKAKTRRSVWAVSGGLPTLGRGRG